jgi:hypothetical protein
MKKKLKPSTPTFNRFIFDLFWLCPATFREKNSEENSWNQLNDKKKSSLHLKKSEYKLEAQTYNLKHKFYTYSWYIMRDHILRNYTISLSYRGNIPHHIHLIIYLTWVIYREIYHISWSWKQLYSFYLLINLKQKSYLV